MKGQEQTWINEELPEGFSVIHAHGSPVKSIFGFFDDTRARLRWKNKYLDYLIRFFEYPLTFPLLLHVPSWRPSKLISVKYDAIHLNFPDFYNGMRWKILGIMKYFIEQTNDNFLFLTSSSSYVNPEILMESLENLRDEEQCVGALSYLGAHFPGGSNRLFTRKLVLRIIKNRKLWDATLIEDLALGKLLLKLGVETKFIELISIANLEELGTIPTSKLLNNYHFRLKSQEIMGSDVRRNDVTIFHALHKRIMEVK